MESSEVMCNEIVFGVTIFLLERNITLPNLAKPSLTLHRFI